MSLRILMQIPLPYPVLCTCYETTDLSVLWAPETPHLSSLVPSLQCGKLAGGIEGPAYPGAHRASSTNILFGCYLGAKVTVHIHLGTHHHFPFQVQV